MFVFVDLCTLLLSYSRNLSQSRPTEAHPENMQLAEPWDLSKSPAVNEATDEDMPPKQRSVPSTSVVPQPAVTPIAPTHAKR